MDLHKTSTADQNNKNLLFTGDKDIRKLPFPLPKTDGKN